ncbi:FtsK/SpoIIIE family DNA translocase [Olsenella profusa]|uniref:FtsK/SpoIIIE family DNA translocase n=1 Tax=Olsenella profusa TaxID=138595 RepID=UPI003522529B
MAAQRRTNAAQQGKPRRQASPEPTPIRGTVVGDLVGVGLIVASIAMIVSVVAPSSAVVTRAMGQFLELCFGVGAILCPIALIVVAATFFVDDDGPISGRIALGLVLIVLAILGILSINMSLADAHPDAVLVPETVVARGGYVGGAIAWGLLVSVGRIVGNVILVGVVVAGIVVCGFSVSDMVTHLRDALRTVRDAHEDARARREGLRSMTASEPAGADAAEVPFEGDGATAQKMSFLGNRTTTVLRRNRDAAATADGMDEQAAPTHLLKRRRHPDLDVDVAEPAASETAQAPAAEAEPHANVPDFLQDAVVGKTRRRRGTKRTTGPSTGMSAACETKVARAQTVPRPGDETDGYGLPSFSMLSSNPNSAASASSREELDTTRMRLQGTLEEFGLRSRVVDYVSGPLVTTFRIEMGEGERVNKIRNLEDDIALTLAAEKVRIFAPIPGTSYVGIEIPNRTRQNVHLGDVLPYAKGGPLEVAIGRDSAGKPVIADISKMPHMLVAGTTGSGKSVMINSMIMSLLMRTTPKQVRLIMIDPKRVEFSAYNGLPHLYVPVVTEPRQAASALAWAVSEMERRLKVFAKVGAREIKSYNRMCVSGKLAEMDNPPEPMPFLVVIIDELSDLMMVAGKDVEASIVRIAQLARAAGIHLVIATQRPSANVVTGLIKSNIDSRVALKVSSGIDSRVILDETGAERLLGNGDMLFKDRGLSPKRVLGCYTSDSEINSVVDFIRGQAEPDYHEEILTQVVPGQPGAGDAPGGDFEETDDPLVWEAAQIVVESQLGSTSGLQRRLKVGYARAGRIMDMLESKGVVGPPDGSKPREVLLDKEGLEDLRAQEATYQEV